MQLEDYFRLAEYVVEVTTAEKHFLWEKYHKEVDWDEQKFFTGFGRDIGRVDKRPITVSFRLILINKLHVLFWEATSELVDYKMIDDYMKEHCNPMEFGTDRRAKCYAEGFYNCISYSNRDRTEQIVAKYENKP